MLGMYPSLSAITLLTEYYVPSLLACYAFKTMYFPHLTQLISLIVQDELSFYVAISLSISRRGKNTEKMCREISKVEIVFEKIWDRREESACEDKCSCLSVVLRFRSIS